jgi:hypothetical protein
VHHRGAAEGRRQTALSLRRGLALARLPHAAATALCPTACKYLERDGMSSAGRLCGVHTGTPTNSRSACGSGGKEGARIELAWQQKRACLQPRQAGGQARGRQAAPNGALQQLDRQPPAHTQPYPSAACIYPQAGSPTHPAPPRTLM